MKFLLQNLGLLAAYMVTALLGLRLDAVSGFATLVWAPTGIALAALFLYGRRLWPAVALGAFAVNLYTGASPLVAAGIALGNTLEAYVAAELLRRVGFRPKMERMVDVLVLLSLAGFMSTFISATVGVASLWTGGQLAPGAFAATWQAWWIGDMLGVLIIAPVMFVCLHESVLLRFRPLKSLEAFVLAASLLAVSQIVFGHLLGGAGDSAPVMYIVFLPLIWAAIRFGVRGTVASTLALACLAIIGTVLGRGPFVGKDLSESLMYLQVFMGTIAASALFLAASIAERRRAEKEARRLNEELKKQTQLVIEEHRRTQATLESIGEGVISVDQKGRVMSMNGAAEDLLGYPYSELAGKILVESVKLVDADGKPVPKEKRPTSVALKSAETARSSVSAPVYVVRKDGTRFPVAFTVSPVVLDYVRGAVIVFRDIADAA